jgi:glutamyl-tRNA synthetase
LNVRPGAKKARKMPVKGQSVYIDKSDDSSLKGQNAGLMFLCTANMGEVKRFVSREVSQETPKIHWVPDPAVKIKVVMPDGSMKHGLAEAAVKKLKAGRVVQFYRVGFCRIDKVGKEVVIYFSHK